MNTLKKFAALIDELNALILRLAAWLTIFMVLVQFFVVIMRYAFGTGSVQLQESIIYMHGVLFMIAAAGTLLADAHVRVDIFYRQLTERKKAWVNLFGIFLFLLPFCFLIIYTAWDYVANSWQTLEGSRETSGIQAVYLLKTIIPLTALLLGLQGCSQAIKAFILLRPPTDPAQTTQRDA